MPEKPSSTLQDKTYQTLHQWLTVGRFLPGERLKIRQVADELGVGIMPVRAALQSGVPTPEMMKQADLFLRSAAGILMREPGTGPVSLKVVNLVAKPFDKLRSLMERDAGRSDYRLSVPGYGEGRMAFVRL